MKQYVLTKLSSPGYELRTEHLSVVCSMLDSFVCGMCREGDPEFPDVMPPFPVDFEGLPLEEKTDILLSSACGCEFMLEVENDEKVET